MAAATRSLYQTSGVADLIADDDLEAESILEALSWTTNGSSPSELQQTLKKRSECLNMETIDFLLQWENDESESDSRLSRMENEESRFRETFRVLDALKQVDVELEGVDFWLEEQLDHLAQIKSKLSRIEAETGALESSWQNLSAVQTLIQGLLGSMTLSHEDEQILFKPEAVVDGALRLTDLDMSEVSLRSLMHAATKLKTALDFSDGKAPDLNASDWKHIKSLAAIAEQRKRLADISYSFCTRLVPTANSIFGSVLKHRTLHDPFQPNKCIDLKGFNLSVIMREGLRFSDYFFMNPLDRNAVHDPPLSLFPSSKINNNNGALVAQRSYHSALSAFVPLLQLLIELTPALKTNLGDSYVRSTHERLYAPILRTLFKDIQTLMAPRQAPITLANIPKYRLAERNVFQPPLRFIPPANMPTKSTRGNSEGYMMVPLTPWSALGTAILAVSPIIKREDTFFQTLFKVDASGTGGPFPSSSSSSSSRYPPPPLPPSDHHGHGPTPGTATDTQGKSKAEDMLDILFDSLATKLARPGGSSLSQGAAANLTGASESDGIEAIGMLMVLQQFMIDHLGLAPATAAEKKPSSSSSASVPDEAAEDEPRFKIDDYCPYLVALLMDVRSLLLKRLKTYLAEQVAWIQQQKGDPKKAGVHGPVARFPSLVRQALEMTGGQTVDFVEQFLFRLAKEILNWITVMAGQNDKYEDVVKIQNYSYFVEAIGALGVQSLDKFVEYATQQLREAEVKYIQWMVKYEFPALSALTSRVEGVGGKVKEEELSLYIRRKDVLNVVKELDTKSLTESIANMHKRMEKHFGAAAEEEMDLVGKLWLQLRDRVVGTITRLEEAATTSYQISLQVGPQTVSMMFDRFVVTAAGYSSSSRGGGGERGGGRGGERGGGDRSYFSPPPATPGNRTATGYPNPSYSSNTSASATTNRAAYTPHRGYREEEEEDVPATIPVRPPPPGSSNSSHNSNNNSNHNSNRYQSPRRVGGSVPGPGGPQTTTTVYNRYPPPPPEVGTGAGGEEDAAYAQYQYRRH